MKLYKTKREIMAYNKNSVSCVLIPKNALVFLERIRNSADILYKNRISETFWPRETDEFLDELFSIFFEEI